MKTACIYISIFIICCSVRIYAQPSSKISFTGTTKALKGLKANDGAISEYQVVQISSEVTSQMTLSKKREFHIDVQLPYVNRSTQLIETNLTLNQKTNSSKKSLTNVKVLTSDDLSSIRLTVAENFIYGFFTERGKRYYIEPLRYQQAGASADEYIIYPEDAVRDKKYSCASNAVHNAPETRSITDSSKKANHCLIVSLAIASTKDMVARYGSVSEVMNRNAGVMNMVAADYINFANMIEYEISRHYVSSSIAADPVNSSADMNSVMTQFKSWSSGSPWKNNFKMAQLWTARDLSWNGNTGPIGYADTPGKFQILEDAAIATASLLRTVTSHEIGHNWKAYHDNVNNNIMSGSVITTSNWNPKAINSINARVNQMSPGLPSCDHTNPKPVAKFNASSVKSCGSSIIYLNDESLYGGSRSWSVNRGNLSSSSGATTRLTLPATGHVTVTLSKSNNGGSHKTSKVIQVINNPHSYCKPSANYGTGGISFLDIRQSNNSTSAFSQGSQLASEIGSYTDYSCHRTIKLNPGTNYTVSYTASSKNQSGQQIWVYIDYNDDGIFHSTNELITNSNYNWRSGPITYGTKVGNTIELGLRFDTPNNIARNRLYRLRVKSDNLNSSNPCYVSAKGQIKDYYVHFGDDLCNSAVVNVSSVSANNRSYGGDTKTLNSNAVINKTNIKFAAEKNINLIYPFEVKINKTFTATTAKCPN